MLQCREVAVDSFFKLRLLIWQHIPEGGVYGVHMVYQSTTNFVRELDELERKFRKVVLHVGIEVIGGYWKGGIVGIRKMAPCRRTG